jgi:hypothetical protein
VAGVGVVLLSEACQIEISFLTNYIELILT